MGSDLSLLRELMDCPLAASGLLANVRIELHVRKLSRQQLKSRVHVFAVSGNFSFFVRESFATAIGAAVFMANEANHGDAVLFNGHLDLLHERESQRNIHERLLRASHGDEIIRAAQLVVVGKPDHCFLNPIIHACQNQSLALSHLLLLA